MSEDTLKMVVKEHLDECRCQLAFEDVWEKAHGHQVKRKLFKFNKLKTVLAFAAALILVVGIGATAVYEMRKDDVSYTFKKDEKLLGEWKTVDFVKEIEDFNPENVDDTFDLYLRGLEFKEGGTLKSVSQEIGKGMQEWEAANRWSKGYSNHYGDQTRSTYEIREIQGKEYLFYQWKSGDYIYGILDFVPYYVLERGTPTERNLEGRVMDDLTYNFVNDPEVLGVWKTIDFVDNKESFDPKEKQFEGEEWLTGLTFEENGGLAVNIQWKQMPARPEQWSKGYIVSRENMLRSAYEIIEIDGKDYLFYEWKVGDYALELIEDVPYYVFERVE